MRHWAKYCGGFLGLWTLNSNVNAASFLRKLFFLQISLGPVQNPGTPCDNFLMNVSELSCVIDLPLYLCGMYMCSFCFVWISTHINVQTHTAKLLSPVPPCKSRVASKVGRTLCKDVLHNDNIPEMSVEAHLPQCIAPPTATALSHAQMSLITCFIFPFLFSLVLFKMKMLIQWIKQLFVSSRKTCNLF